MKKLNVNKILLIDDDHIATFLTESLLKKLTAGEEILIYKNGADALTFLKTCLKETKESPQMILLDINMPVLNGYEFLTAFKSMAFKNHADVQIVVLTTSTNSRDIEKMRIYGVTHYINKPLNQEKLQQILESHPLFEKKGQNN
jgi:CheY-like chemotaxis protein